MAHKSLSLDYNETLHKLFGVYEVCVHKKRDFCYYFLIIFMTPRDMLTLLTLKSLMGHYNVIKIAELL